MKSLAILLAAACALTASADAAILKGELTGSFVRATANGTEPINSSSRRDTDFTGGTVAGSFLVDTDGPSLGSIFTLGLTDVELVVTPRAGTTSAPYVLKSDGEVLGSGANAERDRAELSLPGGTIVFRFDEVNGANGGPGPFGTTSNVQFSFALPPELSSETDLAKIVETQSMFTEFGPGNNVLVFNIGGGAGGVIMFEGSLKFSDPSAAPIPLPAGALLFPAGLGAIAWRRRRAK